MNIITIKEKLNSLADLEYCQFISKLLPGVSNIIGVRMPILKNLAKDLAKKDWHTFIEITDDSSHEIILLEGLVISYAKTDINEILDYIEKYLSKINNWATCDSFASNLKITHKYSDEIWNFLMPLFKSSEAFKLRFAIVMLLTYYVDEIHLYKALNLLNNVHHCNYYVNLAVAWAISIFFINFPEQVMPFLIENNLDDFTYKKVLQKIRESKIPNAQTKTLISNLKR